MTQAHPLNLSAQNPPRHVNCVSLIRSYPGYGMTAQQLLELGVVLPINNRVIVRNLNAQQDEETIRDVFS